MGKNSFLKLHDDNTCDALAAKRLDNNPKYKTQIGTSTAANSQLVASIKITTSSLVVKELGQNNKSTGVAGHIIVPKVDCSPEWKFT